MPELRKDLLRGRWVALATDRALRPDDFPIARKNLAEEQHAKGYCPFCEGNEGDTPPEAEAFRDNGSLPDTPGWKIRVFPNKFSAFDAAAELKPRTAGIYPVMNGVGIHEVMVETPDHDRGWQDYTTEEIYHLLQMYQHRYAAVRQDPRVRYIQLYKNSGLFAGASLEHSHSQLIAFPFVPDTFGGFMSHFRETGHCLICDMLQQEIADKTRVLYEGEHFVLFCPYASRFAYEAWLVPKKHRPHFQDLPETETKEMAQILHMYMPNMLEKLKRPAYNLLISGGTVNGAAEETAVAEHWFMEITPRMMIRSGVEVASGVYINPVGPECAAEILREGLK